MFEIFAYVERMKYIRRWALMRSLREETDMEHSFQVTYVAHALAMIRNGYYGGGIDVGRVLEISLFHDLSETLTGDMPTPVKYCSPVMKELYDGMEDQAKRRLLITLPDELRASYESVIRADKQCEEYKIVKAADRISAYLKCLEETKAGNGEFRLAMEGKKKELDQCEMPEVTFFMERIVPVYMLSLDELHLPE